MVIKDENTIVYENNSFYANDVFIQIGGREIFLDFHRLAPRFNPLTRKTIYVREHATIILQPGNFKELLRIGGKLVTELESKYGNMESPEFIQKLQEEQQNILKESQHKSPHESPNYFG